MVRVLSKNVGDPGVTSLISTASSPPKTKLLVWLGKNIPSLPVETVLLSLNAWSIHRIKKRKLKIKPDSVV